MGSAHRAVDMSPLPLSGYHKILTEFPRITTPCNFELSVRHGVASRTYRNNWPAHVPCTYDPVVFTEFVSQTLAKISSTC